MRYPASEMRVERDMNVFKDACDLIVVNRMTDDLADVTDKVFTRDLFNFDLLAIL